jgi:glycosyltransferase involved in cell wall biosynthesis
MFMRTRSHANVSIVIPTLNEEKNIGRVIDEVWKFIGRHGNEIIVVDGHSEDDTVRVAKSHGARVLMDSVGKGSALVKGLKAAKGRIVVSMDADLSHEAKELLLIMDSIEIGYDVCMGSRFMEGGKSEDISFLRIVGNKFFVHLVNFAFGANYTDMCYGYRGFSRKALSRLHLKEPGFGIETEINIKAKKAGLRVIEVPSVEKKRAYGTGKLRTFSDGYQILMTILKNWIGIS